jgi:hypothetical protein
VALCPHRSIALAFASLLALFEPGCFTLFSSRSRGIQPWAKTPSQSRPSSSALDGSREQGRDVGGSRSDAHINVLFSSGRYALDKTVAANRSTQPSLLGPLPSLRALVKTHQPPRGGGGVILNPCCLEIWEHLQLAVFNVARHLRETAIAYL